MNELKLPEEWCRIHKVTVIDPDGWRGQKNLPEKAWDVEIDEAEFNARVVHCTVMHTSNVMLETEKAIKAQQEALVEPSTPE